MASNALPSTPDTVRFDGEGSFLAVAKQLADVKAAEVPTVPAESELDDAVSFDDAPSVGEPHDNAQTPSASTPSVSKAPPAEPPKAAGQVSAPAPSLDVSSLVAGLRVQRTAQGGITVEASPEAAEPLAALFEAMAKALRAQ